MKETQFINQNKEKWRKFENAYKANSHNPDELSHLFVEITEDLSYARTHYPKRTVRVYLNNLAQDVFTSLYRIRNNPFSRFIHFWTKSLPLEAYRMRKDMLFALLVFVLGAGIGIISMADDINYADVILGSGYVDMTNQHIADYIKDLEAGRDPGSPLQVYATSDAWPMFVRIFKNNIQVAFFTFISGLIFGIGTLFFLMYNSIMVGTFQSYFYFKGLLLKKSLLYATFLTIWIHGAFEISAIVLSAACGFTMGRSIMFPKTMTRLQSLQQGAKRGLKVFIGLSVFILLAAILESWVTRMYLMENWVKLLIILASFIIMFVVFVFIPFLVARKYPEEVEIKDNPSYNPHVVFNLYSIRNIADVMTDTFRLYRRLYAKTLGFLFLFILPVSFVYLYFSYNENAFYYNDKNMYFYENCMLLFGVGPYDWWLPTVFWPLITGIFLANVFYRLQKNEEKHVDKSYWKFMLQHGLELGILFLPLSLLYQYSPGLLLIFVMFVYPLYLPVFYAMTHAKGHFFTRLGEGLSAGTNGYGNGIGVYFLLFMLCGVFFALFTSQLYYILEELITWHLETRFTYYAAILQLIKAGFFTLFWFHFIKLMTLAFALVYYHVLEAKTSKGLYAKLDAFGKSNKYYETQTEEGSL